jgi:hypothetical protein
MHWTSYGRANYKRCRKKKLSRKLPLFNLGSNWLCQNKFRSVRWKTYVFPKHNVHYMNLPLPVCYKRCFTSDVNKYHLCQIVFTVLPTGTDCRSLIWFFFLYFVQCHLWIVSYYQCYLRHNNPNLIQQRACYQFNFEICDLTCHQYGNNCIY